MAKQLFINNATGYLNSSITNVATSIVLQAGQGASFPSPTGSDYFYATLFDGVSAIEIVKVTARSTDTLTVVRGQESTSAQAFAAGSKFEVRVTAAGLSNFLQKSGDTITNFTITGQITSTQATGTAPFVVASITQVDNLNSNYLQGKTWAIPGDLGTTTPGSGAFTTLSASGKIRTSGSYFEAVNSSGNPGLSLINSTLTTAGTEYISASFYGTSNGGTVFGTPLANIKVVSKNGAVASGNFIVQIANAGTLNDALTVDAPGNLGLGVTPVGTGGCLSISGNITVGANAGFTSNLYYNGSWKYSGNGYGFATYANGTGGINWDLAANNAGGAGAAASPATKMMLDVSGSLLLNQTSTSTANSNSYALTPGQEYINHVSGSGSGFGYLIFAYGGTQIGSITQNGTTAVAYNTTSDHRLKENVRPADAKRFMDIEFVDFEWVDGRHDCGVIAHQLQSIYPDLVLGEKDAVDDEGNPVYQQVNFTGLIGRMGTTIQKLHQRIEVLENKLGVV